MGGLTSMDAVYIAILFIVPGYIFTTFRSYLVAGQRPRSTDYIIKLLTLSAVNFALFGWIIYLAVWLKIEGFWRSVLWMVLIVVLPAMAGGLSGMCTSREWFRKLYELLRLQPIHVIPSSWDYKFSKSKGEWILVTLKDGTKFAGWWGSASFASSEPTERDIYIEQMFEIPEDDHAPWAPTSRSVLIFQGEIRTIEFIPNMTETKDD